MADQVVLLRHGLVEQDAPPAEIYARPETSFVASFIGTPPMNLFSVAADGLLDGVAVAAPGGAPMLVGIRPEALRLAETGLLTCVAHGEYLGADTIIAGTTDGQSVLARLPGRVMLEPGSLVHFAYAPGDLHLFDAGSGRRNSCG